MVAQFVQQSDANLPAELIFAQLIARTSSETHDSLSKNSHDIRNFRCIIRCSLIERDPCIDSAKPGPIVQFEFCQHFIGRVIFHKQRNLREQIVDHASASKIKREAVANGFRTLRMDGSLKVKLGMTTPEEVLRVTQLDVV